VAAAARTVAELYGESRQKLERDLCELCGRLQARDIVRVVGE